MPSWFARQFTNCMNCRANFFYARISIRGISRTYNATRFLCHSIRVQKSTEVARMAYSRRECNWRASSEEALRSLRRKRKEKRNGISTCWLSRELSDTQLRCDAENFPILVTSVYLFAYATRTSASAAITL